MISYIYIYIYKYLGFAAVLASPVWTQQLCLSLLDHRFDFQSMSMIIILTAKLLLLSNESLGHSHTWQESVGHMAVYYLKKSPTHPYSEDARNTAPPSPFLLQNENSCPQNKGHCSRAESRQ
jgi:hypothetical protein